MQLNLVISEIFNKNIFEMLFTILLIITVICIGWIFINRSYRDVFEKTKNFESFIKNPWTLARDLCFVILESPSKIAQYVLYDVLSKPNKSVKLWLIWKLVICITTPEDFRRVTTSPDCLSKGSPHEVFDGYEGSILHTEPSKWKVHRRLLNSTLNLQMTKSFIDSFNICGRNLVKNFEIFLNKEIDVLPVIGTHVADLTFRTSLGQSLGLDIAEQCYHDVDRIMFKIGQRLIRFLLIYFGVSSIIKHFNLINIKCDKIEHLQLLKKIEPALKKTKEEFLKEFSLEGSGFETEEEIRSHPDSFLKRLYRLIHNGYLEESEFNCQLCVFLIAADTPTNAIANCVLCLAMFPDIQEKVFQEINQTLYDGDLNIDSNIVLDELPYFDRFIKECLRFFPPGPIITRKANKDIELEHGIVPAGTDIFIPILSIQRNKNFWGENADKFDPDNFLPEKIDERHQCTFVPYSYGSRNCIGHRVAQFNIKIFVAYLIKKYKFSTRLKLQDLRLKFKVTASLINKHMVTIHER